MITTINLTNTHITLYCYPWVCVCVCVVRTLRTLDQFQVYNILLLTVVIMLYIKSSELNHLMTASVYPVTNISPFPYPLPLATTNLLSISLNSTFCFCLCLLDSKYKWGYIVFVFLRFISLSIMSSSFIHVITNGRISSFLGWIIFHYI